jgi:hypothetical protein
VEAFKKFGQGGGAVRMLFERERERESKIAVL